MREEWIKLLQMLIRHEKGVLTTLEKMLERLKEENAAE